MNTDNLSKQFNSISIVAARGHGKSSVVFANNEATVKEGQYKY